MGKASVHFDSMGRASISRDPSPLSPSDPDAGKVWFTLRNVSGLAIREFTGEVRIYGRLAARGDDRPSFTIPIARRKATGGNEKFFVFGFASSATDAAALRKLLGGPMFGPLQMSCRVKSISYVDAGPIDPLSPADRALERVRRRIMKREE